MKTHVISLTNAIILIGLSLWAYLVSSDPSPTALIPTFVGLVILILNPGLRKENKVVSHIVVLLTFLIIVGLIRPLTGALDKGDDFAVLRVVIMQLSSVIAIAFFVKSFLVARQKKVKS